MNHTSSKRQRREEEDNDNISMNSSMDNTANGDDKDAKMAALKSKNALLELKNENLEGKLENQALKAKIRELMEENAALKQANEEQIAQLPKFEKFDEFMKQQQKEIDDLKTKNQADHLAFLKQMKEGQENAQEQMNQMKETIQANQIRMKLLAEEMTILKEEQQQPQESTQQQQQGLEQMKPEHLWHHIIKAIRLEKPGKENRWDPSVTNATISPNGMQVSACAIIATNAKTWLNAVAMEAFGIAPGKNCRMDLFPGTILYYYEMTQMAPPPPPPPPSPPSSSSSTPTDANTDTNWSWIGFTDRSLPAAATSKMKLKHSNSYAIHNDCDLGFISGKAQRIGRPTVGGIKLELKGEGDVIGCGLLLSPKGKLAIFFTANGTLLNKQIPIEPTVDCLYPAVFLWNISLDANFGDDQQAKPFIYDIDKCPGMTFE